MEYPLEICNSLEEDRSMKEFVKKINNLNRQELKTYYRTNEAHYKAECKKYLKEGYFNIENSKAYIMPRERSLDIDNELDYRIVKVLIQERVNNEV